MRGIKLGARTDGTIRFGVILLPYDVSFKTIARASLEVERLGFDSLWISDHLQRGMTPVLECWSVIAALAATTKKIRIGSMATCNSFRNPALLAKIIATASDISKGRIDIGIGIGYDRMEHKSNGYDFPSFQERVTRLSETLQILNSLWDRSTTTFAGKYYKISNAMSEPKPKNKPKIWVAGRNDLILTEAAKYAQGINILPYSGAPGKRKISSIDELRTISEKITAISKYQGRTDLAKSIYSGDGGTIIGRNDAEYQSEVKREAVCQGLTFDQMERKLADLSIVYGNVERCVATIEKISKLGFEEIMLIFPGWQRGDYRNMRLFAEKFLS